MQPSSVPRDEPEPLPSADGALPPEPPVPADTAPTSAVEGESVGALAPVTPAGQGAERRTSLRRRKQQAVLIINPAESEEPHRGWLVDRSLGGLGLMVDQPMDEGTLLRVRATNAPARLPWVEVHVKNCRPGENVYELGCQFVRTPSWEVLLTFG